jgi:uncharacterized protein (DUF433 family)
MTVMIEERPDYTTTEVAVLAGVPPRAVNKAIEEKILRPRKVTLRQKQAGRRSRGVSLLNASAIFYVSVVSGLNVSLTREQKKRLYGWIASTSPDSLKCGSFELSKMVTIHLAPILGTVVDRVATYKAAREKFIAIDADILGGTPCIKGTRVTVYAIAARAAGGEAVEEIIEDYPELTPEIIESAVTYAEAHPLIGRPGGRPGGRPWR